MRLTLRTLLAWMDGVLPPAVAAELGSKVEASPAAQTLADRIRGLREFAGRVPPPDGPDLATEINAVAEYLDNALDASMLADFERDCLASDTRLAEVAACHRILAEYAAISQPADAPRLGPAMPPPGAGRPRMVAESGPRRQVVDHSRRTARASWLLASVATVLLLVLAGLFGWSVIRDRSRRGPPPAEAVVAQPAAARIGEPPARVEDLRDAADDAGSPAAAPAFDPGDDEAGLRHPATNEQAVSEPSQRDEPRDPARAALPAAPDTPAAADDPTPPAPASSPPQTVAIDVRVPFGDALAIAARSPAAAVPAEPVTPGTAAGARDLPNTAADPAARPLDADPWAEDPPTAIAQARLVAGPPVLYLPAGLDDGGANWLAAVAGRPVPLPADIVATGPGTVIALDDGVELRLRPGSRAAVGVPSPPGGPAMSPDPAAAVPRHVDLRFGGLTIAGRGAVAVSAGDLVGVATLGPGAPLGLELELTLPPGADPQAGPAARQVRLVTADAPVGWRQTDSTGGPVAQPLAGLPPEAALPRRSRVLWSDRDPAAVVVEAVDSVPPWVGGGWPADRLDRAAADEFTARLADDPPAAATLARLADSPREEVRAAAAAALATLGDYRPLVRQLCAETPRDALREGRWRQLESATVPLALARGPAAAAALAASFAADGPPGRAADLVRLARGFSDEELAAGAAAWLVLALDDPQLVVRRYAIRNLHEISDLDRADRLRYRADRDAGLRREGVNWWRSRQEQGLVGRRTTAAPPRP